MLSMSEEGFDLSPKSLPSTSSSSSSPPLRDVPFGLSLSFRRIDKSSATTFLSSIVDDVIQLLSLLDGLVSFGFGLTSPEDLLS